MNTGVLYIEMYPGKVVALQKSKSLSAIALMWLFAL